MSQADAFTDAYSAKGRSRNAIYVDASRLIDKPKISLRISELRRPAIAKAMMTLEGHLDDLMKLRNLAVQEKQVGAAITAEIARGKAAGIHIEKSQIDLNNLNPFVIVRYGNKSQ